MRGLRRGPVWVERARSRNSKSKFKVPSRTPGSCMGKVLRVHESFHFGGVWETKDSSAALGMTTPEGGFAYLHLVMQELEIFCGVFDPARSLPLTLTAKNSPRSDCHPYAQQKAPEFQTHTFSSNKDEIRGSPQGSGDAALRPAGKYQVVGFGHGQGVNDGGLVVGLD